MSLLGTHHAQHTRMLSAPERRRKVMDNGNAKAELERIRINVMENLRHLAHTPSARHPNPACIL